MNKVPNHIVLFPDGNRRWAQQNGLKSIEGHQKGNEKFQNFLRWCQDRGVKIITVFGFSTENWKRDPEEIQYLMNSFERGLSDPEEITKFQEAGVRIKIIGQKDKLSDSLQKTIKNIEEATKNNDEFLLNLGVSYGGKWDITQALKRIVDQGVPTEEITEELIEKNLSTAGAPSPDLVIRAGGEKRLSNFVLWQSAYAELYFSDKLWPDFEEEDLDKAFEDYNSRQRRFGGDS